MRKIYIGADSAGYTLKTEVISYLEEKGYEVIDCGTDSDASCHYPLFANAVCEKVKDELQSSFGILICGTGIGISIAANKMKGIRCALLSDCFSAEATRLHNDTNVMALGGRVVGPELAVRIVDTFRTEINYAHNDAKWDEMSFQTDALMINAIIDARIDNLYRPLRNQMIVPYVGLGAGISWNSANDGIELDKKITPVISAMAGLAFEFNDIFALDLGYKYFYMFKPESNVMPELNPVAHQLRAGARISF